MPLRSWKLSAKLILFLSILILVSSTFFVLLIHFQGRKVFLEQGTASIKQTSNLASSLINLSIEEAKQDLLMLSGYGLFLQTESDINKNIQQFLDKKPFYKEAVMIVNEETLATYSLQKPDWKPIDAFQINQLTSKVQSDFWINNNQKKVLTELEYQTNEKKEEKVVYNLSTAITNQIGQPIGLAVLRIDFSNLVEYSIAFLEKQFSDTTVLYISDTKKHFNVSQNSQQPKQIDIFENLQPESNDGNFSFYNQKHIGSASSLKTFTNNQPEGLWLVAVQPVKDVLLPLRRIEFIIIMTTTFLILMIIVGLYLIVKSQLSPLKVLTDRASKISSGNYETGKVLNEKNAEFKQLNKAFNEMTLRINENKNLLQEEVVHKTKELRKFMQAAEFAVDHIVITDKEGVIIYVNPAITEFTGFKKEECLNEKAGSKKIWGGLMPAEFYKNLWQTIKVEKKPFYGEVKNKKKDGTEYISQLSISPILNDNNEVEFFIAIERDITDNKKQAGELKEAVERFTKIFNSAPIGMAIVSPEGKFLEVNPSLCKLLGYKKIELLQTDFRAVTFSDDLKKDTDLLKQCLENKIDSYSIEKRYYHKKGYPIWALLSVSAVKKPKSNQVHYFIAQIVDISDQKEIEKTKTEFVSIASHQLRTPLSAINWYAEILEEEETGPLNKQQKEYLAEIAKGNKRMIELVNALLDASRIELGNTVSEVEKANLNELAKKVIHENQLIAQEKQQKVILINDSLPKFYESWLIEANTVTITLHNLLSNAIKYSEKNTQIEMFLGHKMANEYFFNRKLKSDSLVGYVKDQGYGIPDSDQDHIFEKLYRASNVKSLEVEGTGLGLYIVKSLIRKIGGDIWFSSDTKSGTVFYFFIPTKKV